MTDEIPRRRRVDQMTPIELLIRHTMLSVEALPTCPPLTEAQEHVADFVDDNP